MYLILFMDSSQCVTHFSYVLLLFCNILRRYINIYKKYLFYTNSSKYQFLKSAYILHLSSKRNENSQGIGKCSLQWYVTLATYSSRYIQMHIVPARASILYYAFGSVTSVRKYRKRTKKMRSELQEKKTKLKCILPRCIYNAFANICTIKRRSHFSSHYCCHCTMHTVYTYTYSSR